MSSILVGAQGLVVLLAVILLNVPIAAAMALVGAIGTLVLDANAAVFSLFGTATVQALSSQDLIVIPLFILLGGFAIVAGLSTEIYRLAHVWFGHLRGGLAMTTSAPARSLARSAAHRWRRPRPWCRLPCPRCAAVAIPMR